MAECSTESKTNKTLTLNELEILRAKSVALDKTVEWLKGQIDSEKLMTVNTMLRNWMRSDGSPRKQ